MAGKVTKLERQKKNRERMSVYIDGSFAVGLPAIVAARLSLGQFLSDADIETLRERGDRETAYDRVLNYLSYRPRSRSEVITYLQKREVPESQIESIVGRLEGAGLLDDESFARFWVENRERFRPRGLRALRYELRDKGLDDKVIEQALVSVDASASAYRAASKKVRQWRHLDELEFKKKMVGYLARRGFDYGVAREVVERHWKELGARD